MNTNNGTKFHHILLVAFSLLFLLEANKGKSQNHKLDYKVKIADSGFLFLIASHNSCVFVITKAANIEQLVSSREPLLFLPVHVSTTINDSTEITVRESNLSFRSHNYKQSVLYYSKVYLESAIPISLLNHSYFYSGVYIQSGRRQKKLYPLTNTDLEFYQANIIKDLLH